MTSWEKVAPSTTSKLSNYLQHFWTEIAANGLRSPLPKFRFNKAPWGLEFVFSGEGLCLHAVVLGTENDHIIGISRSHEGYLGNWF